MDEDKETMLNIVNASGFIYQLNVEKEIRDSISQRNGRWDVVAREYRWEDQETKIEGYIDLVLQHGVGRIIIECKRVNEGKWVFLLETKNFNDTLTKLPWYYKKSQDKILCGYDEFIFNPGSPKSNFCLVRGQGEKDKPMLERISSNLIRSLECFAAEEISVDTSFLEDQFRIYIPIIVTNAKLYGCLLNSKNMELETGKLSDGEFQEIHYVRFNKSLPSKIKPNYSQIDIYSRSIEQERTVIIINSMYLKEFLSEFKDIKPNYIDKKFPWEKIIELENQT